MQEVKVLLGNRKGHGCLVTERAQQHLGPRKTTKTGRVVIGLNYLSLMKCSDKVFIYHGIIGSKSSKSGETSYPEWMTA